MLVSKAIRTRAMVPFLYSYEQAGDNGWGWGMEGRLLQVTQQPTYKLYFRASLVSELLFCFLEDMLHKITMTLISFETKDFFCFSFPFLSKKETKGPIHLFFDIFKLLF